jgi:hypothetical protein
LRARLLRQGEAGTPSFSAVFAALNGFRSTKSLGTSPDFREIGSWSCTARVQAMHLKFTRTDVRQIARLENEGGVVGSDDAP